MAAVLPHHRTYGSRIRRFQQLTCIDWYTADSMICPLHTSLCTSTVETAVYENRTYGGVGGRRPITASYPIYSILKAVFI